MNKKIEASSNSFLAMIFFCILLSYFPFVMITTDFLWTSFLWVILLKSCVTGYLFVLLIPYHCVWFGCLSVYFYFLFPSIKINTIHEYIKHFWRGKILNTGRNWNILLCILCVCVLGLWIYTSLNPFIEKYISHRHWYVMLTRWVIGVLCVKVSLKSEQFYQF